MYILNYIFSITQYFSQDVFNITLVISFLFALKYWKKIISENILIAISAFVLYSLIYTYFVQDVQSAMENEVYIYAISWLVPFILGYCVTDEKHKHNIIVINIYILAFLTIIGFFSCFGILPEKIFNMRFSKEGLLQINALWHVPFAARTLLMLLICFSFSLFCSNIKKNLKILFWFLSLIFYIAILLSTSRLYFLIATTFIIIIFGIYIYKIKKFKLLIYLLSILILIFVTIYFYVPSFKNKIKQTNINDINIITRISMYKYSIEIFKKHPIFGIGPGQAIIQDTFFELKTDGFKHTHLHSAYLHILANYGIVGFIIFLYIIIYILYKLYKKYRQTKSIIAFSMLFIWIAVLLAENIDFVLKNYFTATLYFWFTGLALSKQKEDKN